MADMGWRRRRGSSPRAAARPFGLRGLTPASASNTLSCQRETLHSQQLKSIKKSIDSNHGIYRYHCRGDDNHVGGWLCIGIGGVRIDKAVAAHIVEAVSGHAVEAAIKAAEQAAKADDDVRQALSHELEEARYEASLAARRYEVVDPTKRLVARELETRWNVALERVAHLE